MRSTNPWHVSRQRLPSWARSARMYVQLMSQVVMMLCSHPLRSSAWASLTLMPRLMDSRPGIVANWLGPTILPENIKRPYGLNHKGFHKTTASYRLEDDVGECLVYESRRVGKQEGPEDKEQEPMACVTSKAALLGMECANVRPANEPSSLDAVLPSIAELSLGLLNADA
ncbi:hypothetical protein CRG98_011129 [Punica granatum]|uniref:Uncharacterized protein n=1 Tax=Punica granatum TaxID=22663 RepID=A0A2I0KJ32_PUNGR|nr:hypothetical protein CRG98_011129 [Punica granatum]